MRKQNHNSGKSSAAFKSLRVGFVPLTDCAPVVMAEELGLFRKHGLRVTLSRELGWATVRDKIVYGELDASHAIAGLPFATTLGIGSVQCPCVTGLVLNQHGNAITVSRELARLGVTDAVSLRDVILAHRRSRMFTFGIVHPFSSHHFLLRQWLAAGGIDPDRDLRLVVVPPPQMFANLKAGHVDGYCVGEPWNSAAVRTGIGWVVSASAELAPGHPEKVLMVREAFASERALEHEALIAALLEACAYCDVPANRPHLVETLARGEYVNTTAANLMPGLSGRFEFQPGQTREVVDFDVFHRNDANRPSAEKAGWVLQHLRGIGIAPNPLLLNDALGRRVFRADIFERAFPARSRKSDSLDHEILHSPEHAIV